MATTESLVQYNAPVLVSSDSKSRENTRKNAHLLSSSSDVNLAQTNKKANQSSSAIEEVLNSILPPKEWTENNQLWIQYVSSAPAYRQDIIKLQQKLDYLLQSNQAKEYGVCSVRQEYYYQCFDELIRQVTIACSERGLLLLRVRDEMRFTAVAYEKLYESNVAHGIRKSLIFEHNRSITSEKVNELKNVQNDLKFQIENLKKMISSVSALAKDKQQLEAKKNFEEVCTFYNFKTQICGQVIYFTYRRRNTAR